VGRFREDERVSRTSVLPLGVARAAWVPESSNSDLLAESLDGATPRDFFLS
jgi:hypothetical protein